MFRLFDFLKSKKMVRNSLKLLQTWQPLYYFFIEKKLLERLDQAILDVCDKPEKTQQTTAIGTLFWQTL